MDDEGRVLEVRDEEGEDREELLLGELRARYNVQVSAYSFHRAQGRRNAGAPACGT